jgi:xanthine dehydrogenase YagR molybdenum-binding subunit
MEFLLDGDVGRRRQADGLRQDAGVQNVQRYVCGVFEMKPDDVRVMSAFVGGAFGSDCARNFRWSGCAGGARAEALGAARADAQQMYALGYRPAMIQRSNWAQTPWNAGAISHDAITVTSQ